MRLDQLHEAMLATRCVTFAYTREDGARTQRTVRPLGLFFWSGVWTLAGWCELRKGFRTFRLDRMAGLTVATEPHVPRAGESLEDYRAMVRAENPEA